MADDFRLLMISAMYENGGNVTHRLFDGHPQMFVYPFESQLGTRHVIDHLSSMFPVKYRWPEFALDATPQQDYRDIIDEECKVRARTPQVSKFRHKAFDLSDEERARIYLEHLSGTRRSRANNVAAFFRATFDAWRDHKGTPEQSLYVGYSPIIAVDAGKILADLPRAHILHVVRNPWSAYADTKKRPVPLSLEHYMLGWTLSQYNALLMARAHPARVHIVRLEDVVAEPSATLGAVCDKLGLERSTTLEELSWNGEVLEEAYPWGTLRRASTEANLAAAAELSGEERGRVGERAWQYLDEFDYRGLA